MTKALVREQKDFTFQIKEFDDDTGTVKGYLSTFNNIDETGDRVRPGSFKRTLQSKYEYKKKHNKTYLMPLLWQHSSDTPIGGYTEAKEDSIGLYVEFQIDMDVQRGREAYSGLKKGYIFQQSIGYDTINSEYVKEPDGKMVRDLLEIRLWEGSVVTFPANELAVVTSVKSAEDMEQKSVCGNTSGPIGPRDESWSGSAAEKWIWSKALDENDEVKPAIAKKYFMRIDGDPTLKGSYGYPFWINDHISVGGVKACANALSGARNADAGGDTAGMKKKVETLYRRINKAYPDDPELTPPWEDDGKAGGRYMQRKTFEDHFNQELACDLLRDWQDVFVDALTCAVFDAFSIGDEPASDVSDALDAFKKTVLTKFVVMALECDLAGYLSDNAISYTPGLYAMQNGSDNGYGDYGYMSSNRQRSAKLREKAGRAVSAANQATIDGHVKAMKDMATKAKADMKEHVNAMHDAVDAMSGNEDDGGKSRGNYAQKAGRAVSAANAQQMHEMADKAMEIMSAHTKAVTTAADDFATTIQGALKPAYGTGEGEADDDQQEGRGKSRQSSPYQKRTPATQNERPPASTALEDVEIPASWIKELRKAV